MGVMLSTKQVVRQVQTASEADLRAVIANARTGDEIRLPREASITVAAKIQATKALTLDLNGSILVASPSFFSGASSGLVNFSNKIGTTLAIPAVAVTANSNVFVVPNASIAGRTYVRGDLLYLRSSTDVWVAAGTYMQGMCAVVQSVSSDATNTTIVLNRAFHAAFNVDSIEQHRLTGAAVCNGSIDMSAHTNGVEFFAGVQVFGVDTLVEGLRVKANDFGGMGVHLSGDGVVVRRSRFDDILNTQGITGGGRLGYGVQTTANGARIEDCSFYRCKHSYSGGPRDFVAQGFTASDNTVVESAADPATITGGALNGTAWYTGALDMHAGMVGTARHLRNTVYHVGIAVNVRNGDAEIVGNKFVQLAAGSIGVVSFFERAVSSCLIDDNEFRLQSGSSVIRQGTGSVDLSRVTVGGKNRVYGGSVVNFTGGAFGVYDLNIDDPYVESGEGILLCGTTGPFERVKVRAHGTHAAGVGANAIQISPVSKPATANVRDFEASGSRYDMTANLVGGFGFLLLQNANISGLKVRENSFVAHRKTFYFIPIALTLSATSGASVTVTAASAVFDPADVGLILLGTAGGVGTITGYTSPTVVTINVTTTFAATAVAASSWYLQVIGRRGINLSGANIENGKISDNQLRDTELTITATGAPSVLTEVEIGRNQAAVITIAEGSNDIQFQGVSFPDNELWHPQFVSLIQYTPRAGTTAWANSREVLVSGGRMWSSRTTQSITLDTNSGGHKFRFDGISLRAPINYAASSGDPFGSTPPRVKLDTGTQLWKGGVTVKADGFIYATAAPTTGTWGVGDEVRQLTPVAGNPKGWLCTAAGTPGTWVSTGNL